MTLEFNYTDYEQLLQYFAKQFNCEPEEDILRLPSSVGSGYLQLIRLHNGLQCILSDYTVSCDIHFNRTGINKDFYTLRFDEVTVNHAKQNDELSAEAQSVRSAVFLGSAKFGWRFSINKGTHVKGLDIIFTKEWLAQFIGIESVGEIIRKYFSLKMSAYNHEPMDVEYKQIFMEVLQPSVASAFQYAVVQNRVMLLIERFFTLTYRKINEMHFHVKTTNDDIERVQEIEKTLTTDFSVQPPGISTLARAAGMSSSKLKNCFKEVYGVPIYQYYQKKRLSTAKAMLISRKCTVREAGNSVGYINLSNFSKAFKKAFDQLPSDLLS